MPSRSKYTPVAIELDGPLFSSGLERFLGDNANDLLDHISDEIVRETTSQISSHSGQMPYWTGWTLAHVHGTTAGPRGRSVFKRLSVFTDTQGMDRTDAIRTKAAAAGIERRWHPFRRVATASRKAIRTANLVKGLE